MLIILLLFTIFVQQSLAFSVIFIKAQIVVHDFHKLDLYFFLFWIYTHSKITLY